jgi:hypothetical protein
MTATRERIQIEVEVANNFDVCKQERGLIPAAEVRRLRIPAVVSPKASYLVLPQEVAMQLGVPDDGTALVEEPDGRRIPRPMVKDVRVVLCGRHGSHKAIVDPRRKDALIGMIVLGDLDLVVDDRRQAVAPRDPRRIVTEL